MPHISFQQFSSRFVTLILGSRDFPNKQLDRHIILISAMLGLDPARGYSEAEINAELQHWTADFGRNFNLDPVTLRRYLVDERYLVRDAAGQVYRLNAQDPPYPIDPALFGLDLDNLVFEARQARELKRQAYLASKE